MSTDSEEAKVADTEAPPAVVATESPTEVATTEEVAATETQQPVAASVAAPVAATAAPAEAPLWRAIPARQRRLLGVLMEKAKTTPDAYPLSLTGLVTGANQKSNRYPLMNLTPEQVEDDLTVLRRLGAAAEIQGSGRVARYRHYGHAWLGVKGADAAVMIELLLRGHQTAGDLRGRACRFEPIPDLPTLQTILSGLIERNLVIALTPSGRGQLFSHNLYLPEELEALRAKVASSGSGDGDSDGDDATPGSSRRSGGGQSELATARAKIEELTAELAAMRESMAHLHARLEDLGEPVR